MRAGFAGEYKPTVTLPIFISKWNRRLIQNSKDLNKTPSLFFQPIHKSEDENHLIDDDLRRKYMNHDINEIDLLIDKTIEKDRLDGRWLWNNDITYYQEESLSTKPKTSFTTPFFSSSISTTSTLTSAAQEIIENPSFDFSPVENQLEYIITQIFKTNLLVNAKNRKIIIIENIFLPRFLKRVITNVFLLNVHALSLSFVPMPLITCISSGVENSLIIDIGWQQLNIIPVYDLRVLYKEIKSSDRSGMTLHYNILKKLLKYFKAELKDKSEEFNNIKKQLTFDFIEEFIYSYVYMKSDDSNSELDDIYFTINFHDNSHNRTHHHHHSSSSSSRTPMIQIPSQIRHEIIEDLLLPKPQVNDKYLYDDNEQPFLTLFRSVVKSLPLDLKPILSKNIIFTGGLSNIPGLKSRLLHELNSSFSYGEFKAISNLGNWCGASLYSQYLIHLQNSKNINLIGEITRNKYISGEELIIPDWVDSINIHRNGIKGGVK